MVFVITNKLELSLFCHQTIIRAALALFTPLGMGCLWRQSVPKMQAFALSFNANNEIKYLLIYNRRMAAGTNEMRVIC